MRILGALAFMAFFAFGFGGLFGWFARDYADPPESNNQHGETK